MELCETCTERNCKGRIVETKKDNLVIIKCLDYEKDKDKIQGYKKPLERTAKFSKSVMGLYNPSWN
ncbi:MAG: hypothetical protein ACI4UU_00580 [Clostridia bacterium]